METAPNVRCEGPFDEGYTTRLSRAPIASLFLIAGTIAGMAMANAAPNIPPGEMPGRERERFAPSPLDRFTDPLARQQAEPLYRWCDRKPPNRTKRKPGKRDPAC
jgi:hypothetical protein